MTFELEGDIRAEPLAGRDDGGGGRVELFEAGLERHLDLVAGDAHLQGQGPARVVIGRDGRAAGVLAKVGIFLLFEERPGVGLVGLGHEDDERAGRIEPAAGDEFRRGPVDLDAAVHQDVEHLHRGRRVVLRRGDDEGVGLALVHRLDGVLVHLVGN